MVTFSENVQKVPHPRPNRKAPRAVAASRHGMPWRNHMYSLSIHMILLWFRIYLQNFGWLGGLCVNPHVSSRILKGMCTSRYAISHIYKSSRSWTITIYNHNYGCSAFHISVNTYFYRKICVLHLFQSISQTNRGDPLLIVL